MNNRIFLGGTCAETTWRTKLEKVLRVPSFNPVVEDWTPECQDEERLQKNNLCNIHLYVITKEMQGVFSIAEVIDSTHQKGKRTILHVIPDGFEKSQLKSLNAVCDMVNINGGIAYVDSELNRTARVINYSFS
tara:strand:+ start:174 stop:572 length:399 start_codon:yes stop_codon:yes gene_type:complete